MFNSRQHKKIKEYFNDKPFLVHHTPFIYEIIQSKYILPSIETNNYMHYDTKSPYVFFSISNSSLVHYINPTSLLLCPDFLLNEPFYINKDWRFTPKNNEIKVKSKTDLTDIFTVILEIYNKKPHKKSRHLYDNEVLYEKKVSIENIIGIVLDNKSSLEYINTSIEKCKNNITKYKNNTEKTTLNNRRIISLNQQYKKNVEIIEFCDKHNIAIIYHKK